MRETHNSEPLPMPNPADPSLETSEGCSHPWRAAPAAPPRTPSDDELYNFWLLRDCIAALDRGDMRAQFVSAARALLARFSNVPATQQPPAAPWPAAPWPARGVRVQDDRVVILARGATPELRNAAARQMCAAVLAQMELPAPQTEARGVQTMCLSCGAVRGVSPDRPCELCGSHAWTVQTEAPTPTTAPEDC